MVIIRIKLCEMCIRDRRERERARESVRECVRERERESIGRYRE